MWPWKWGQGHQNLIIISFLCLRGVSVQVWSKSTDWFRRWECRQGSFYSLIVWWPWKLGQGQQNLIYSFNYPNDTIHKVWPVPSFDSRDRMQISLFLVKIWHSKCWCDLENEVKVTIRAIARQCSSLELSFANKTKVGFRAKHKRRNITGPWNICHCDLNLFWGQRLYYTDSFSKNMTFIHQILFKI